MEDLTSERYRRALRHIIGVRALELGFHWHYTPNGCSVSPHCDAKWKLGSHIFYLNTEDDWEPAWGGETVGARRRRALPAGVGAGVRGLRQRHVLRGGRELQPCSSRAAETRGTACARSAAREDRLRKVLIVVIQRYGPIERVQRLFGAGRRGYG